MKDVQMTNKQVTNGPHKVTTFYKKIRYLYFLQKNINFHQMLSVARPSYSFRVSIYVILKSTRPSLESQ